MDDGVDRLKQAHRAAWSAGDYRPIGELLETAAEDLVTRADVRAGHRVIDVGVGAGGVAIAAARRGASVVGIDLTPAWFGEARTRSAAAGVELGLREGDAEALPVADEAFDRVLSGFAMIFAPRHSVVAGEAARVCRPGGLVGFTAWTPDSMSCRVFEALSRYLPEPPSYASPSSQWGDPDHVRRLFADHDVHFDFDVMVLTWEFPDVDAFERFLLSNSGPMIAAQQVLEQAGRWQDARAEMRAVFEEVNRAMDGSFRADLEYLLAVGRRSG